MDDRTLTLSGYFARNLRAIEVLVDQEVIRNGRAATEPWKFYDLGHGYCTYDFFEQCPHRMACARCDFYLPKQSSSALLLEGKQNLLRLLQEMPLGEAERAAVEEGIILHERLIAKLADVLVSEFFNSHGIFRQLTWPVAASTIKLARGDASLRTDT